MESSPYVIKPATLSGETSPESLAAEDWWEQCPRCDSWVGRGMMNSHKIGRCLRRAPTETT